MKKQICLLLLCIVMLFSACAPASAPSSKINSEKSEPKSMPQSMSQSAEAAQRTTFNIAGLKGPTTMGVVKLMSDVENGTARHDYNVEMFGSAEEITPKLIKGEMDAAIIPCNLASVLFNKTEGDIVVAAINNLGVLYVLNLGIGEETVQSVADLKGKNLYTTGKGTTPEYILNYILKQNGLDVGTDINVQYKSEATEAVTTAMLQSSTGNYVMLPQPYVQSYIAQTEGRAKIVLDMNEEWNKISNDSQIVTGVLVARKAFIEENELAFAELLEDYKKSIEYTATNTADAAQLIAKYGIVPKAELAEKALPFCSLQFIEGADMKKAVSGYLQVLFDQNPQSVGGKLPDDSFYYKA